MSFNVSYIFEVQDKMSATLNKISGQIARMSSNIQSQTPNINKAFYKIGQGIDSVSSKMQNFGDKMRNMSGKASLVSLPVGFLAKNAYQDFAEFEQLQTRMAVAFQEDASKMTKAGQDFAMKTALSTEQVFGLMSSLKQSVGMGTQEIMPFIEQYTTALYGLGAGKNFDAITEQIKQGLGKGKLELVDIKVIESWGLPIKKMVAETLGVTTADVMDMISEKGGEGVTSQMLQDAFRKYSLDPRFADSIDRYAKSSSGAMDRLGETYKQFKISFGAMLDAGGVGNMIGSLSNFFEKMKNIIDNMSPSMKKFFTYFTLLVAILPPILFAFGVIVSAIGIMATGFGAVLGIVAGIVGFVVSLPAIVIAIIAAVVIFRKEIWNAMNIVGEFLYKWTGLKLIVEGIGSVFNWLADKLTLFISKFDGFVNAIASVGNMLGFGVDETQQVQRPKSIAQGENVFEENVAKGQMSYKSSADVNVMFGNTPKGTSIQTTQKGADFMKLGIQQQTFSPAL